MYPDKNRKGLACGNMFCVGCFKCVGNVVEEIIEIIESEAARAEKARAVVAYDEMLKKWQPKVGDYVEVNPHGALTAAKFVKFTGEALIVATDFPGVIICVDGIHVRVNKGNIRPTGVRCPCCGL